MSVKIYVEGGGDQRKLKRECRRAFSKFFEKAEFKGKMPRVVACGSRNDSYADFCTAVKTSSTSELPLLLVDSEAPVQPQHKNKGSSGFCVPIVPCRLKILTKWLQTN
jgi:hypothetical protein